MSDSNLTLGFVGLGVMGEPMCRNLARKSGKPVLAFDLRPEPLQRASEDGVEAAIGDSGNSLTMVSDFDQPGP